MNKSKSTTGKMISDDLKQSILCFCDRCCTGAYLKKDLLDEDLGYVLEEVNKFFSFDEGYRHYSDYFKNLINTYYTHANTPFVLAECRGYGFED